MIETIAEQKTYYCDKCGSKNTNRDTWKELTIKSFRSKYDFLRIDLCPGCFREYKDFMKGFFTTSKRVKQWLG